MWAVGRLYVLFVACCLLLLYVCCLTCVVVCVVCCVWCVVLVFDVYCCALDFFFGGGCVSFNVCLFVAFTV